MTYTSLASQPYFIIKIRMASETRPIHVYTLVACRKLEAKKKRLEEQTAKA